MIICLAPAKASKKDVIHAPLDIISLDDITPEERKQIAEFEAEINRHKRLVQNSCYSLVTLILDAFLEQFNS